MSLDPDAVRLAEELVAFAQQMRYGQLKVTVTVEYLVNVREGKVVGAEVKEILPKVTSEQLRRSESVIT